MMLRLNSLLRINSVPVQRCLFSSKKSSSSSDSSSSSSSDDEQKVTDTTKSTEARKKLNLLLTQMIQDDVTTNKQTEINLARPKKGLRRDVRTEPGTESIKRKSVEEQVVKAVKDVAETIGGNVKQNEMELLQKLLNSSKDESVETATVSTTASLSELFKDMKIDRETKAPEELSRANQVRQLLRSIKGKKPEGTVGVAKRQPRPSAKDDINIIEERVNLFGSEPLGIFPSIEEIKTWNEPEVNQTWRLLHERELRLAITHPPSNYFQQMILWTEQGKLWKFPIDNEQDLEDEKKVYFTEHIFLEKYLEPWCPAKGPVRHFMELVCVGLSKNPYLTVEKKREHIVWFRGYFDEKAQLLRETGAIAPDFEFVDKTMKQIEK